MQGDRENFLQQSGADGYISKPVVDHQKFVDDIAAMIPA
jgi:two-component system cell cycle response regulator DivK